MPVVPTESEVGQPEPVSPKIKASAPLHVKHRNKTTADDLAKQLSMIPEVRLDIDNTQTVSRGVLALAQKTKSQFPHPAPLPLTERPDLSGLPIRMGLDCHLGKEAAENLNVLSNKLRAHLVKARVHAPGDHRPNPDSLRASFAEDNRIRSGEWEQPEAVPALVQMLMQEDRAVRMLMVEMLGKAPCSQATTALAQRALFDLSPEVRDAALNQLRERPIEEFRDQLLAGLRYPWAPAADHAAEALVALKDRESLLSLVDFLGKPDPSAPVVKKGRKENQLVVKELVRVSHLGNCLMCHAPSFEAEDMVRGQVPVVGRSLDNQGGGYGGGSIGTFVRADITYLKQDFSVQQPVAKHGAWPTNQRFDYMVRTRPAQLNEVLTSPRKSTDYPQREAVLFALREITGEDFGTDSKRWRWWLKE